MNDILARMARDYLNNGLAQCTTEERLLFKRMYSHTDLSVDINDVLDKMPDDELDHAMLQVQRTLEKRNES